MTYEGHYNWETWNISLWLNNDQNMHNEAIRICKNTYKNAIRQLYSVKCVTQMWENDEEYDLYLYIRPDLLYTPKLDISIILKNIDKNNILFTPDWGQNPIGYGLNDRIYFGKKDVMLKIANRIDLIPKLYGSKMYHAERFMKSVVDYYGINTVYIKLLGERIRSNGLNQEVINESRNELATLLRFGKNENIAIKKLLEKGKKLLEKGKKLLEKDKKLLEKGKKYFNTYNETNTLEKDK